MATTAYAAAASTSMSATAVLMPCRLPTTAAAKTIRCSAMPYLPPRLTTPVFSTCLKPSLTESRRFSLLQVKASSSEETSVDAGELFSDLKEKEKNYNAPAISAVRAQHARFTQCTECIWDRVENKSTVLLYGGGAIVAVWISSTVVSAVNSVPLLPKIMELVGLGYTGWFVYRYLLFKSSRKELATDIEALKKKIAGTE